jgi:hypothetical protein
MRLSFSDANLTTEEEMTQHAVKYLCLLAVLLTLPVTATAQQRRGDDRRTGDRGSSERGAAERGSRDRDDRDRNSRTGDKDADQRRSGRPTTGFNPAVPSWEQKQVPWWERQGLPSWERGQTPTTRSNNNRRDDDRYDRGRRYNNGGVVYVVPSYPYFQDSVTISSVVTPPPPAPVGARVVPEPPPAPPSVGFLTLDVEPRALLQIYVDDVFIGTPADLGDELRLSPGTRRIELRARGYKTLTFSAEIVEDRSINYRGQRFNDDVQDPGLLPGEHSSQGVGSSPGMRHRLNGHVQALSLRFNARNAASISA